MRTIQQITKLNLKNLRKNIHKRKFIIEMYSLYYCFRHYVSIVNIGTLDVGRT